MNPTITSRALPVRSYATWLWATVFVAGNLVLPQLCHLIPDGGKMLLPIMLFTVVATVRFGLWCGLLTALASPLMSVAVFGVPSGEILTAVVIKSIVIALAFGFWKQYKGGFSIAAVLLLVVFCQAVCFALEGAFLFGMGASWHNLLISWPGMLLQAASAVLVIKLWK